MTVTIQEESSNLVARLEPYGIHPATADGLRERLAAGFLYPENARMVEAIRLLLPDGSWQAL